MTITIGFDVYGTLIDTHGVVSELQTMIGNKAKHFSQTWREKQLEYSFRRGLMQNYENFAVCTKHALDFTCSYYQIKLTKEKKNKLLDSYKTLPAFNDVKDGLVLLKKEKYQLYAFSNGSADAIETLLINAGIRDFFGSCQC